MKKSGGSKSKLTIKQKKFVDEYIISGNATESYLKSYAKQSRTSAEANARKLLGKYSVKTYLEERLKELEDKSIAKQDEVLKYLTSVLRGEEKDEVLSNVGDIAKLKVNNKDRLKAAELFGKFYGMWTDKLDVTTEAVIIKDDLEDGD